jgi:hypothetical protein
MRRLVKGASASSRPGMSFRRVSSHRSCCT